MAEKRALAAIKEIEVQIEVAHKRRRQKQDELLKDYLQSREPLLQRRYELVTGRSEPTDEELKGFKPQGAAAAASATAVGGGAAGAKAAASTGACSGAGGVGGRKGGKGSSPAIRGVPFFWLNALCNEEKLAALITPRDRCALEYLEDVRYVSGPMGLSLEFHFAPNPYFHNKVLRKGAYVKRAAAATEQQQRQQDGDDRAGAAPLMDARGLGELFRGVEEWREEATVIDWKPERSLLVRAEAAEAAASGAAAAGKTGPKAAKGKGQQRQASKAGAPGGGGGGKKGMKGASGGCNSGGGGSVPSRSKRHHGKHSGPAPDLPDPEEEEQAEEQEEEKRSAAAGHGCTRRRPCQSFFRFFLPLTSGDIRRRKELDPTQEAGDGSSSSGEEDEGDGDDEGKGRSGDHEAQGEEPSSGPATRASQRHQALDAEVMDAIVRRVIPRALHLYLAGAGAGHAATGGKAATCHSEVETEEVEEEEGFQLVSGNPAGDVASLALSAQSALHALMGIQRQLDELSDGLKAGEWAAWRDFQSDLGKLAARRRTLLVGPAGAPNGKLSIPAFWLRVLRALPFGSLLVQHRDERALSYLADVRLAWDTSRMPTPDEPHRKLDLELEFLPGNPYFSNTTLRKRFTFHAPEGSLNRMWVVASQSDPIDWYHGRDLTTRVTAKGGGGGSGRTRKVPSFFSFFDDSPGALCRAFNIPGRQSAAALQEANQAHEEFLAELINVVVQFAGSLAAASNIDVDDLGDEREEDEDEDEEEDEDEDDGDESDVCRDAVAARRAARLAAATAGRRRGCGSGADGSDRDGSGLLRRLFGAGCGRGFSVVTAVFVVVMIVAQVLVFYDTLEYVRGHRT